MRKSRSAVTQESAPSELASLPATYLRVNTRDVIERVKFGGERILIETFGRPMVVLISYKDYLCIREHLLSFAENLQTSPDRSSAMYNEQGKTSSSMPTPLPIDLNSSVPPVG